METKSKLLISGQRRSGTTLVARLLNVQNGVRIWSDFLHIDRLRRHIRAQRCDQQLSEGQQRELKRHFQFLNEASVRNESLPFGIGWLHSLKVDRLIDFYRAILDQAGGESIRVIGHKSTMAHAVFEELLTAIPELQIVYVIRDPRDVVNSSLARQKKDPRFEEADKSIFAWIQEWAEAENTVNRVVQNPAIRDRILIVRYEDLVLDEKEAQGRLARFLGLKSIEIPPDLHKGADVTENASSFGAIRTSLDSTPIGRWKTTSVQTGRIVEILLSDVMHRQGYTPSGSIDDGERAEAQRMYFHYLLSLQYGYLFNEQVFNDPSSYIHSLYNLRKLTEVAIQNMEVVSSV